jgi:hypothetical protein
MDPDPENVGELLGPESFDGRDFHRLLVLPMSRWSLPAAAAVAGYHRMARTIRALVKYHNMFLNICQINRAIPVPLRRHFKGGMHGWP